MLTERLRQAIIHAGDLPEVLQQDIADQIESFLSVPPVPLESITISHLVGDDGTDAFFDQFMDDLDRLGHSVPPTPPIEDK